MTQTLTGIPAILDRQTWRGRVIIPVLLYMGVLVAMISSVGAPLIPLVASDYHVSLADAQWSLTITLLVGAMSLPTIGWLADGPRRRTVMLSVLVLIIMGCVLAALPLGFLGLLIGRALQGFGLGVVPITISIARDHVDEPRRRRAVAMIAVATTVSVSLGFPLTGFLAEHLGFHAPFWVSAGLGVLALIGIAAVIPGSDHRRSVPFAVIGWILLSVGLAALLLVISQGETWGWGSRRLWPLGITAVVLLVLWIRQELRTDHPLVELRLMRHPILLAVNLTSMLLGVGLYMLMSLTIRFVQSPVAAGGLGESVQIAGLVLIPMTITGFLSAQLVVYLGRWLRPERIMPLGPVAFSVGMALFALSRGSLWEVLLAMTIAGLASGCSVSVMPFIIVSAVPADKTANALALHQLLRVIGYSTGSALSAMILAGFTPIGTHFPAQSGYSVAAWVAVGMFVATGVIAWVLVPNLPLGHDAGAETATETTTATAPAATVTATVTAANGSGELRCQSRQ